MQTVIVHPQTKAQETAITAILDALNVPYEIGTTEGNVPNSNQDTTKQHKSLLELKGTGKGLWKDQMDIDQYVGELRNW